MNVRDIALRAQGYGIPGVIVDGTNALAMYEAAQEAVARARRGEGPTLIEAKTHRRGGHAEGEEAFLGGQHYFLAEEREAMRRNDPLIKLHTHIVEHHLVPLETLETLDQEIGHAVVEAIAFARASEAPDATILYEDTWV
jgi:pyruvate dehydrogenase E1 component alpha subunit